LDGVILAGVDRGGGGQHGEGSEFENGELHDCCYGFGAAAFCFMVFYDDFMQSLPRCSSNGSIWQDLGNNLILTRVSCTWVGTWVSNPTGFHVEPDLWASKMKEQVAVWMMCSDVLCDLSVLVLVLFHSSSSRMNIMSSSTDQPDEMCANCGKAEVDEVRLKICTACKLVKYCSVDRQKNHRPQHKKACKKRATEIRDDHLFTQPDGSCYGECPICCLPLPLDASKWSRINS
jgi:hypothetical protein